MSGITSHVLDTSRGCPADGMAIRLERRSENESWIAVGADTTNADGRVADLTGGGIKEGVYRISFATGEYFKNLETEAFYPSVQIEFVVVAAGEHHHVPLLLNPFGYSTYRGS